MVDADGATQFSDLDKLDDLIKKSKNDNVIVFGSRDHLKSHDSVTKRHPIRNMLMFFFHLVVTLLVGTDIKDTQCGFKLFTRKACRSVFSILHLKRWAFDIEIVVLSNLYDIKIYECPVNWHEVDGSKLNLILGSQRFISEFIRVQFFH